MKLPLTGGAYQAASVIASAQRSLNLFGEPMGQQQGEPGPMAHYPTPGLRRLGVMPENGIRGIKQTTTGGIYCVAGAGVYLVDPTSWTGTLLGSITPLRPYPVSMQDNGITLVIVDGTAGGWTVDLASHAFAAIDSTAFYGADKVDYLDTYLLFNKPNTPQFYSSDSLAVTFDPLWFANKESFSDLLVTLAVTKREIWLLGERSTEIWANIGAPDFPFQEIQSTFVDHGCRAKYSVATYDDNVFWLSYSRAGQGVVLQGAGYQAKRISTYAIEAEITHYPRIDDAIGFVYALAGHVFYVLTFPAADRSWVFDLMTGLWHEWLWIDDDGVEHRHRANCAYAVNGTVVVGDWQNGNLYAVERSARTDNGQPIKRQRSYPHLLNEGDRVFYRQFLADIESGNPLPPPVTTTRVDKIITWPPQIAQFNGVSVGAISSTTGGAFIDWQRGFVYVVGQTGYQKYTTALETQSPLVTVTLAGTRFVTAADVDPLSGDLILQGDPGTPNGMPIYKLDPTTFAALGTFGTVTTFPSYPTSVWVGQYLVCVVCNGVSFGFLKYSVASGIVSAFRVDTMEHAGFSQAIVSGSTNNRGSMIAGASGGTSASVFLSWDSTTSPAPSVPLYRIDIAASATSYNPATWPATNPGITWTTVGTISVSAVNPAWSGFSVFSLGYDQADGNVLMLAGTTNTADGYRVLKLNATTAAVMWNIATGTATLNLAGSRINGSLWFFRNVGAGAGPTDSYRIDTLTGTMQTQAISGIFAQAYPGQQTDSETTQIFYGGTFNNVTNSPVPVTGTSPFSGGWANMGGNTTRTIVEAAAQPAGNLIWLDWSDDRGHSFGNPVCQPIGNTGEYLTSVQWQRLAYARDRVFRLTWSAPVATALQGAWIELDTSPKS